MKKINPEKFYTPKEIIDFGIMTATSVDTKRQMLLRFIREGRIVATNVGGELKPRYLVQGKNLLEYMKANMKQGQYLKK